MPAAKPTLSPAGPLRIDRGGELLFDETRIALLEAIAKTGSITRAGRAAGVSYRTAWLAIDHLNALADQPLVERSQGGSRGGGTRLTPYGERMIAVYRAAAGEHAGYLERLRAGVADFDRFLRLTRKVALRTSARNQLFGTVASIRADGLSAEVALRLKGCDRIRARITRGGLEGLGLRAGDEAYALVKANWIGLHPGDASRRPGTNALRGTIDSVARAGAEREVALRLPGGSVLVTVVRGGNWQAGQAAVAVIRPEDVILGVAR
jgi:molybdate transport system regulatory protein